MGLVLVTLFAAAVMWATGIRRVESGPQADPSENRLPAVVPAAPVVTRPLVAEPIEVLNTYAGMIQPFERFSIGFEIAGRVNALGQNEQQQDLDEGDEVRQGQVLATLDPRILTARVSETTALLEQAQQELQRARQMRRGPNPAISETDFQTRVTDLAVAEAQAITAQKESRGRNTASAVRRRDITTHGQPGRIHRHARAGFRDRSGRSRACWSWAYRSRACRNWNDVDGTWRKLARMASVRFRFGFTCS